MATVNEKMTALADEVRELSGTTTNKSIEAMTSDVDAANTEITEQMNLISQIANALEGKAAGVGGGFESCTITISRTPSELQVQYVLECIYINSDNETVVQTYHPYELDAPITIDTIKGGLITCFDSAFTGALSTLTLDNLSQVFDHRFLVVFKINGNGSILLST